MKLLVDKLKIIKGLEYETMEGECDESCPYLTKHECHTALDKDALELIRWQSHRINCLTYALDGANDLLRGVFDDEDYGTKIFTPEWAEKELEVKNEQGDSKDERKRDPDQGNDL